MSNLTGSDVRTVPTTRDGNEFTGDCLGWGQWFLLRESDGGSWLHTRGEFPDSVLWTKSSRCGDTHQTCPYADRQHRAAVTMNGSAAAASITSTVPAYPASTYYDYQQGQVEPPSPILEPNGFLAAPLDLLKNLNHREMGQAFAEAHIRIPLETLTNYLKSDYLRIVVDGQKHPDTRDHLLDDLVFSIQMAPVEPKIEWRMRDGGNQAAQDYTAVEWTFEWPSEGTSNEANVEGATDESRIRGELIDKLRLVNLWRDA